MKLYVITDSRASKVGISEEPAKRLGALQTGAIEPLTLERVYEHPNARAVEVAAHLLLAERRARGEWFFVTADEAARAIERAIEIVDARGVEALGDRNTAMALRVRPDLKEKLQELAAADGRTLSNYIEIVLTQHVEAQPKKRRK